MIWDKREGDITITRPPVRLGRRPPAVRGVARLLAVMYRPVLLPVLNADPLAVGNRVAEFNVYLGQVARRVPLDADHVLPVGADPRVIAVGASLKWVRRQRCGRIALVTDNLGRVDQINPMSLGWRCGRHQKDN